MKKQEHKFRSALQLDLPKKIWLSNPAWEIIQKAIDIFLEVQADRDQLQKILRKAPKPYESYEWHGSMQAMSDAYSAWYKFAKEERRIT